MDEEVLLAHPASAAPADHGGNSVRLESALHRVQRHSAHHLRKELGKITWITRQDRMRDLDGYDMKIKITAPKLRDEKDQDCVYDLDS